MIDKKEDALATTQRAPVAIPDAANVRALSVDMLNSGFFKGVSAVPQAVAIILYGNALGLDPTVALQTISIVSGRMCVSTTVLQALFQRHGGRIKIIERSEERARVEFSKVGMDTYVHEYTKEDAIAEELWNKDNWKKRRKTMLLYRCLSGGFRVFDPGSSMGIITTEEAEDYPAGLPEDTPQAKPEAEKGAKKALSAAKSSAPTPDPQPPVEKPATVKPAPAPAEKQAPLKPAIDEKLAQMEKDLEEHKKRVAETKKLAEEEKAKPSAGDDIATMAYSAEDDAAEKGEDPEAEEIIQRIKDELKAAEVDERAFKTWLIEYQKKMQTPRVCVVKLGKALRFHGGKVADLKYLLTAMPNAIKTYQWVIDEAKKK